MLEQKGYAGMSFAMLSRFVSCARFADAPTCAPNQPRVYGVAKQENAEIRCVVDANPPDVEFKWTFNNSAESIDVQASHISRLGNVCQIERGDLICT